MALAVEAADCDKVQADVDVLQLEPVEEGERGGRTGPVEQLAQLIQEGDGLEDVEGHHAKVIDVAGKHEGVPALPAPASKH